MFGVIMNFITAMLHSKALKMKSQDRQDLNLCSKLQVWLYLSFLMVTWLEYSRSSVTRREITVTSMWSYANFLWSVKSAPTPGFILLTVLIANS